jgi:protein-S-isoprenylcysteine O-methyltransferase Ste14
MAFMEQQGLQPKKEDMDKPLSVGFMLIMPVYILSILSVFLFPIAGDWQWLEAWLFVISFTISMTIGLAIINQRNPRVLRNRMKMRKRGLTMATRKSAGSDRWIIPVMGVAFYTALILPAFNHRYGWESYPLWVAIFGTVVLNVGVWIMNIAMLENAHASKILDINQDQALVDTGPYAWVRHPLYCGGILMALALPIALGSLISLIPAILSALMLVIRIPFEEDMLVKGMDGYVNYKEKVRYKLIPGIY